ncbi:MAG: 6,7-dimethyl-8-ribityllumazine synthase [Rhodospirillales bacterium]|nr:6,7-dimethyl-8-ribityllumazine synthase [Rhodospirillales bacterium]
MFGRADFTAPVKADFAGAPPRLLIVEARFYADIADELAAGALAAIDAVGGTAERIAVPGAFEIPGAISMADMAGRGVPGVLAYDGYVALGAVIRGETSHYDYVCGESARGLQDLAVQRGLAIGYGILTVENMTQAWARARRSEGDKGAGAAQAALAMIALRRSLRLPA